VLRGYLGRKYRFPALEMTTEEILEHLGREDRRAPDVERYLAETDFVKFAAVRVGRDEVANLGPRTRELVDAGAAREAEAARLAAAAAAERAAGAADRPADRGEGP